MGVKRNFTRKSGFRDSKLIIIASEGTKTEKVYFEALKEYFNNTRLHIEVLERLESSDPTNVVKTLDKFKSEYNLRINLDQLWLVIDVDRWGNRKLSNVSQQCIQKSYKLAVSNPAFEIWLLLHSKTLDDYSEEEKQVFLQNPKTHNRSRLEHELVAVLGSYNKSKPDMNIFLPQVEGNYSRGF